MNFDKSAQDWDTNLRVERANAIVNKIRSLIENGNQKTMMEFGCGTGLIGIQFVENFKKVSFVDTSEPMLDKVQKKCKENQYSNVELKCIDITSQDLQKNFDYIISSLVIHHIMDIENIFNKFFEILNENGRLIIVDLDEDNGAFHGNDLNYVGHNGFNHKNLLKLLTKIGFVNIEIETFYFGIKEINEEKIPYSLFILKADKK